MAHTFSTAFDIGRSFSSSIEGLKRQPVGLIVGAALLTFADMCSGGGGNGMSDPSALMEGGTGLSPELITGFLALMAGAMALSCVVGIAFALIKCWLMPGYIRFHEDLVLDGAAEDSRVFSGSDVFGRMVLYRLLVWMITTGVTCIALLPGAAVLFVGIAQQQQMIMIAGGVVMVMLVIPAALYVHLGLMLGDRALTLENLDPTAALGRAWSLADGNRITLFLFTLVWGIAMLLSVFAFCVGVVPARAAYELALTEAFLLATHDDLAESALRQPR